MKTFNLCVDYTEQSPNFGEAVVRSWLVVKRVIVREMAKIFGRGKGLIGCVGFWVI